MSEIKAIFEFEMLFDLDYTLATLIQRYYGKSKYFDTVLEEDPISLRLLLLTRTEKNPIYILLKPEYRDSADSLYEELKEEFSMELYLRRNIYFTEFYKFFSVLIKSDGAVADIGVIVNNKKEEAIVRELSPLIRVFDSKEIARNDYDALYIKDKDTVGLITPRVEGKTIFLANYGFNLTTIVEEESPDLEFMEEYSDDNAIFTVDIYSSVVKPV
jgi:hypothetical protein